MHVMFKCQLAMVLGVVALAGCGGQELVTGPVPDANLQSALQEYIDTAGASLSPELITESEIPVFYADEREILDL